MRKHKFRAFRKGKMYDGFELEFLLNIANEKKFYLNAPSTVIWMQFTDSHDIINKEIYEGDIVSGIIETFGTDIEFIGIVKWDKHDGSFYFDTDVEKAPYVKLYNAKNVKVIGNICENFELLI